jgi:hypothetical protein
VELKPDELEVGRVYYTMPDVGNIDGVGDIPAAAAAGTLDTRAVAVRRDGKVYLVYLDSDEDRDESGRIYAFRPGESLYPTQAEAVAAAVEEEREYAAKRLAVAAAVERLCAPAPEAPK